MADPPSGSMPPAFATAVAVPHRKGRLSLVWLVPVVAALVGLWIAAHAFLERGPTIRIRFPTANGLEAGKTQIRYKDVVVGQVTGVALAEDRSQVIVSAQMTREARSLLNDDSRFWVVTARITAGSVSGLTTLVSGAFIGIAPGKSATMAREFTGLPTAPVVSGDVPGRYFALRAAGLGSLGVGSPLYFRQVNVGEVIAFEIDKDGHGVTINVFVSAPYDRFVTANTRFWNASGVDVSLGANGLNVQMPSLVSLLIGGIVFDTAADSPAAEAAAPGSSFTLHSDRKEALRPAETHSENYTLVFRESVRGLAVGAPVELLGINIGEVTAISMTSQPASGRFELPVEVRVYPDRLRARVRQYDPASIPQSSSVVLRKMVASGLRAQLRAGNLLTGQLYVALDYFPAAAPVRVDWNARPIILPTMPGQVEQLTAAVSNILLKLDRLPLDAISRDLRKTLRGLDRTLADVDKLTQRLDGEVAPEVQAALAELRRLLSPDSPIQLDARHTLREAAQASRALRVLADYLERHPEALLRGKLDPSSAAETVPAGSAQRTDQEP